MLLEPNGSPSLYWAHPACVDGLLPRQSKVARKDRETAIFFKLSTHRVLLVNVISDAKARNHPNKKDFL